MSRSTLGAAPSSSTMLGYIYGTTTNSEILNQSTFANYVYSPSTGVAGNLLTPGIYIASMYIYCFPYAGSNVTTTLNYGITSNSSSNPPGGSIVNFITTGIGLNYGTTGFLGYPSFTFSVGTSAYYYSYITTSGGSLSGTYGLGIRTISIARIG